MATATPRDGGGEERGPICGIPCSVESPELRRAVQLVLGQIRERAPEDFQRIRALVGAFVPLPASAASTRGEWKHGKRWQDFNAAGQVQLFEAPGEVELVAPDPDPVPTVAHELGHVCTRQADREARTGGPRYEWVRELCADFYAYKWGFGQDIERARGRRTPWHQGPAPGATFTRADGGVIFRYRVTADFCLRLVQSETPDGRLIATAAQIEQARRQALPTYKYDKGQETLRRHIIDRRTNQGYRADFGLEQVTLNEDAREDRERRNRHGGSQK